MIHARLLAGFATLLVISCCAQSRQETQPKSLGDMAREQRALSQTKKKSSSSRMYKDVEPASSPSMGSEPPTLPLASRTDKPQADSEQARQPASRSVFDQAMRASPDFIIVPAGTEVRVDIVEGKVIVPVRVGFATPVPALSRAAVRINKAYYAPVLFNIAADTTGNYPANYSETAELTSVTVRGVSYPVQAKLVPLNSGAIFGTTDSISSTRDAVFVLTAPLPIER